MGYIPNLYNLWIVAYVAVGATACSYGLAIIGSTVGQPSFYKSLGLEADPTAPGYDRTAGLLGAFSGVNAAGAFIGAISEYLLSTYTTLTNGPQVMPTSPTGSPANTPFKSVLLFSSSVLLSVLPLLMSPCSSLLELSLVSVSGS